jgi:hypothetical protein
MKFPVESIFKFTSGHLFRMLWFFLCYRSCVIIKTPSKYDFKWNMFRSFSPRLWIAVGFTMTVLSVCIASMNLLALRHGIRDDGLYSCIQAMLIVFAAFCQTGTEICRCFQYRLIPKVTLHVTFNLRFLSCCMIMLWILVCNRKKMQ